MDFSTSRNTIANVTRKRSASDNARARFLFSAYLLVNPAVQHMTEQREHAVIYFPCGGNIWAAQGGRTEAELNSHPPHPFPR